MQHFTILITNQDGTPTITAKEAGLIAARARVKEVTPFHFSPRYSGREKQLIREAMRSFRSNLS